MVINVFSRTIVDNIVILNAVNFTCIQEIPKHIITTNIISRNGVISLGRHKETLKSIRLNQIQFLCVVSNVIRCCNYNRLSPYAIHTHKHEHEADKGLTKDIFRVGIGNIFSTCRKKFFYVCK